MLALCLCAGLLCACGGTENAGPAAQEEASKAPSLWGESVRLETEPIPAEALAEGGRCYALSPDGSKLLIAGEGHICLWERESGVCLALTPGDEATEAVLREELALLNRDAAAKETPSAEELADLCFGGGLSHVEFCPGSGNWLLLSGEYGWYLLETDSGRLYGQAGYEYVSACGDQIVAHDLRENTFQLYNRATGEMKEMEAPETGEITSAAFLPDGSLCTVVRGEESAVLLIRSTQGEERYLLGSQNFGYVIRFYWPVGSDYLVLANLIRAAGPTLLIDRKAGTVSALTTSGAIPQNEAMDEAGRWLPEARRERLTPVMCMADGETILLWSRLDGLLLFRLSTLEAQQIPTPEDFPVGIVSGNGYDLMFHFPEQELLRLK